MASSQAAARKSASELLTLIMEYEILVRKRGENDYAAYCPQLDLVVRGTAHTEVEEKMRRVIEQHKAAALHSGHDGKQPHSS